MLQRLRQFKERIHQRLDAVALPAPARRGAAIGVFVITVLAVSYLGLTAGSGFGPGLDSLGLALAAGLALLVGAWAGAGGLRLVRWLLARLPLRLLALAVTAYFLLQSFWRISERRVWWLSLGIVALELFFGGAIGWIIAARRGGRPAPRPAGAYSSFLLGLAGNIVLLAWFFSAGSADHLLLAPPYQGLPTLDGPNLALPGPYAISAFTYGSGEDLHRPEFGAEVDVLTGTVSAVSFVRVDGFNDWARRRYWGFGPEAFPLNGRVWYPQGEGPFPLVLMAHGNHNMADYSDAGYAYLGEHLASHGYIFVSVDENFLNAYVSGTLAGEMDARAWLLLQHLATWQRWADDGDAIPGSAVDMSQIVLMGHSRGGEAAALAAAYNRLDRNPDNGLQRWFFDYDIKGVVAIAPTDQRITPAGQSLPLADLNYLVLHGAHDADVSEFTGLRQYQRLRFSGDDYHFKAALSIYQANHGQFNTDWGARDLGEPRGTLLNRAPLMSGEAQRTVAKLYITAFLAVTLTPDRDYMPLFYDYHAAGDWLPPTLYVNQFQDNRWQVLTNFEEDIDLRTMSVPGGVMRAAGVTRWREQALEFREGRDQDNRAVRLDWGGGSAGRFTLTLPADVAPAAALTFNAADIRDDASAADMDFHIMLMDSAGNQALRPISDFQTLLPPRPLRVTRLFSWEEGSFGGPSEAIMQTVVAPLAAFPGVDPARLARIEFRFDLTQNGALLLDEIGLWAPLRP